jgi:integrase
MKDNSPFWHIDFRLGGRRYCFSSKTTIKKDAEKLEIDTKSEIREAMSRGPIKPLKDATFDQAAGDYYRLRGKRTKNRNQLYNEIARAITFVGKDTRVSTMDKRFMLLLKSKFIDSEEKGKTRVPGKYRDGTVNGFLELVDRIINHAINILKVKVENKASTKDFLEPRFWRKRRLFAFEEKVLEKITEPDLTDAWKFDIETGLREEALCSLTWNQVDLKDRMITIVLKAEGNDEKEHCVYLSGPAMKILLRRYGQHPDRVFTIVAQRESTVGGVKRRAGERIPLTAGTFSKRMKEAFRKAKIDNFTVHDLRHTAAYRLWRKTGDIELIRIFLGHSTVSQTRKYVNATVEDVAHATYKHARRLGRNEDPASKEAGFDAKDLRRVLERQVKDRLKEIRASETSEA